MAKKNTSQPKISSSRAARGPAPETSGAPAAMDAASDMPTHATGVHTDGSASGPTYDEIAEAAYLRYLRRGGQDGGEFDDWVEAERELRSLRSR